VQRPAIRAFSPAPPPDGRASPHEMWCRWFDAMRHGDLERAWTLSDAVLASRDPATRDDPREPFHRRWVWDGRRFDDRDVLVRCYHGLGDTLQFVRFLPLLRGRVRSLRVEAEPGLISLLRCLPGVGVIPFRRESPALPSACDIEMTEIAHALRVGPSAAVPPYLAPPPERLAGMRTRLERRYGSGAPRDGRARDGDAPLVGLCWRGGDWSGDRSVPLADLAACVPGRVRLINLQGADGSDDVRRTGARFVNPEPLEIADAAAAIALADLVVTVDTMIAHLAGALACPVWLLLPAHCDWRWSRAGDRSPWYPTARLYRQTTQGDWSGSLRLVTADLAEWAERHGCRADDPI
jgi:hypothetical protein